MILEGIVTTIGPDGTVNIAPMGPLVDAAMNQILLRPFKTSTTYQNLKRTGEGVLHVTDDVELLACAAIGRVDPLPHLVPAEGVSTLRLADTCRWYSFRARCIDDRDERTTIEAEVMASGRVRDFFGFNRAKHAVIEAAILATRTHLLAADTMAAEFARLKELVDKTGGEQELRAFQLLSDYVAAQFAGGAG
jgi:hypothetical protein